MIKKNNAQAAFDNVALLGLILLVAVAVFYYAGEASNTNAIYLTDTVKNVENTVESLSNLGDGSADTIVIRTPKGVDTAGFPNCPEINGIQMCKTLQVVMDNGEEHNFELSYPVWGSLGFFFLPGTHYVTMVNDGDNQRIVFQECGDGLVSGSEQCEACMQDSDCDDQYDPGNMECYFPPGVKYMPGEDRWGYCNVKGAGAGACGTSNLCRESSDDYGCYCECESDLDCPGTVCLPDGVCGGCENNDDCDAGEYCSLGNCMNCDRDVDGYNANYNSACTQHASGWDCNDNEVLINPGATEICDDLVDNDCDGKIDCDDSECTNNPVCNAGTCNDNGLCEVDETCSNCAGDCGGCCHANLLEYWRIEEGTGTTTMSDKGVVAEFVTFPTGTQELEWDLYSHSEPMLDQWAIWFNEASTEDDLLRISSGLDLQNNNGGSLEFIMDGVDGESYPGRGLFRTCDGDPYCAGDGMSVYFGDTGIIYFQINSGFNTVYANDNGRCKLSGYQCYVAITWEDGSPLKIYVNGALRGTGTNNVNSNHIATLDAPYLLGRDISPFVGVQSFIGKLHQFAFYDKALSDAEISDNFDTYYVTDPLDPFAGFLCGTGAQCGNNVIESPEECDDGNLVAGDGCDASCKNENVQVCGDGIVTTPEACDDGSHCSDGTVCTDNPADCSLGVDDCQPRTGFGQSCDATCNWEQVCGDGIVVGTEECDEGWMCMYDPQSIITELVGCTNDPLNCVGVGNNTCAEWNGHVVSTCDANCNNKFDACDAIVDYWRFEEEVETVAYDAIGNDNSGFVPLSQRILSSRSENILFYDPMDYATLPINDLREKGTILFFMQPVPVSSFNTRVITHDNLIVDLLEIPGNSDEMEIVLKVGTPGNYQTFRTSATGNSQFPLDYQFNLLAIKWDTSNIYLTYNSILGYMIDNQFPLNSPLSLDGNLRIGSSGSDGSFMGFIDEFATFSEMLGTDTGPFASVQDLYESMMMLREGDAYCGAQVCGDSSVDPMNSLDVSEKCDDPLLFGSWGCSRPGSQDSLGELNDCQYANGPPGGGGGGGSGPYCGNGILESGEVCDPPGSTNGPFPLTCPDGNTISTYQMCQADCSEWLDPPNQCEDRGGYCGDGVIDPGEECEPPGSLGPGFNFVCPFTGHHLHVWSFCSNNCGWVIPWIVCPPGDDPGEPPEEDPKGSCPVDGDPGYAGPKDNRCAAPGDTCYTVDCPGYTKELRLSYGCPEGTSAHLRCWEDDIEVKCDKGCQCDVVTPNSCQCDIVCM